MSRKDLHRRFPIGALCVALVSAAVLTGCDDDPATAGPDAEVVADRGPDPEPEPSPEPEPEPSPEPEPDPEPEPTPIDAARTADPEALLAGAVALAVPLADGRVVAEGPEGIALIGASGVTALGADVGPLAAASLVDDALLVAAEAGVFVEAGGALVPSPVGELVEGVTALHRTADGALWILDASGLHVYRDGALSGVSPGPMSPGAMTAVGAWEGTPALWVVGDEALYALGFTGGELQAWSLVPEAPVAGVAVNADGGLWVAAEGSLSHMASDGTWHDFVLPFEVTGLAAHPEAPDVWLDAGGALWQLRDGRVRAIEGIPSYAGLRAEVDGSVLLFGDAGLARVRPGRFVYLGGVDEGGVVDRAVTITIEATRPELVESITAALDGAEPSPLEGPPWQLTVEPGPVPEGAHTLRVVAEYSDGERALAELRFTVQGPPTWEADVEPIFVEHCDACHGERGYAHRMETMETWVDEIDDIIDAIENNRMPLPPNPSVTPEQLDVIRAWAETGFLRSWP